MAILYAIEFFHYTRSERNGLIALAVICVDLVISPGIYRQFFNKAEKTDFSRYQSEIDSFYKNSNQEAASA